MTETNSHTQTDPIARLTQELSDAHGDADAFSQLPAHLGAIYETKLNRVRAERDAARRELCMVLGGKGGRSSCASPDALSVAEERGWDCFREEGS